MGLTSAITDVAHPLTLLDVVELVALPLGVNAVYRVQEIAKNYIEPERALLQPLTWWWAAASPR